MSLSSFVIGFVTKRSAKRFDKATLNPVEVQREKLLSMLHKNADTEYGRKYGFKSIKTIEDYQRQVPIVSYEDIKVDMERVVSGAKNVFTAEAPVMFAQTSGTTGDPKYVPVTPTCRGREHSDQMSTWTYHAQKSHPGLFAQKVVSLVSPAIEGYTPAGIPYGSTSGHIYKNMPGLIRNTYSIPYEVFEIEDYGAKYFAIMRIALEHRVRMLATANPSSVIKMCEKADIHSEDIIRDIHDGTLSQSFSIEQQIREAVEKNFRANSKRAAELETFCNKRGGKLIPADYWPELKMIGCWKGGSVGHYLTKFPQWFSPDVGRGVPVRDMGYLSSEARGSIPLSEEGSKGVLTVATNFVEFVEVEELEEKRDDFTSWHFLTVGDLEMDKEYYIFFTTSGGLYRYDINDIVKVAGIYNKTPEIIFVRKGRGMTNITGEKVSVNQIISTVQKASEVTGAIADHFKAEADHEKSRYIFRVEFSSRKKDAEYQSFLQELDSHLKIINIEYKAKRDSQRLGAPVLHVMQEGWYERSRKKQVEDGMRAFQAKTQLLSPEALATQLLKPELQKVVEMTE